MPNILRQADDGGNWGPPRDFHIKIWGEQRCLDSWFRCGASLRFAQLFGELALRSGKPSRVDWQCDMAISNSSTSCFTVRFSPVPRTGSSPQIPQLAAALSLGALVFHISVHVIRIPADIEILLNGLHRKGYPLQIVQEFVQEWDLFCSRCDKQNEIREFGRFTQVNCARFDKQRKSLRPLQPQF